MLHVQDDHVTWHWNLAKKTLLFQHQLCQDAYTGCPAAVGRKSTGKS